MLNANTKTNHHTFLQVHTPQDNIVKVQQEILLKTGKWLEDDETKQFIENNN